MLALGTIQNVPPLDRRGTSLKMNLVTRCRRGSRAFRRLLTVTLLLWACGPASTAACSIDITPDTIPDGVDVDYCFSTEGYYGYEFEVEANDYSNFEVYAEYDNMGEWNPVMSSYCDNKGHDTSIIMT